ncbi:hypothetical protein BDV27DRAFT_126161 [Aspergillus caelatus]|uniref:Uncharacterized protein n=2 Tax=Aspergillus subgen. Circumdati TaxID=2720871 RepID=A0A5N7A837_9EURO|nr:uncharacterized protein BDV27DRAFT_126161 [Aspergillus caelatus]KAE8365865.1 hypothetical protein BDV27DRAFT_126161 [Aspergillus caelatus]KAE8417587.1 hypothetical protein BDV36DRAFT_256468 [Aspergillus pseudocaelatus]
MHTYDDSWSTYCYYWMQCAMFGLQGVEVMVTYGMGGLSPTKVCWRCEAYLIRGVSSFRGREG